ncbi:hypothetical protein QMA10_03540 [Arthrobacter sp. APC 3897]|uniref:hypothetical protein n=1 Tax=Arthrobacter sp. APC 3897 TaxID=3035204 RepID=UPI0025B46FF0|nr:hypothetical protein [Arthrobacter sp. APC 3897]MDN3480995.1 hypothetical protein [Arthrobacter sp. APC 3897]
MTDELLAEAAGFYRRRGETYTICADPSGDRGRWFFFQVLVIDISEVEPASMSQWTEEEGH